MNVSNKFGEYGQAQNFGKGVNKFCTPREERGSDNLWYKLFYKTFLEN